MAEPETGDHSRRAALRRLGLLDPSADEAFDRLTRLAARVLNVPVAVLNIADEDRQVSKSAVGLSGADWARVGAGICAVTLEGRSPVVLNDVRRDERFAAHPIVADHGLISFLGLPLVTTGGTALGTFCVMDTAARSWTAEDVRLLEDLAASVRTEVELREARRSAEAERGKARELVEDLDAITWEFDVEAWRFTFVSQRAETILGYPAARWVDEPGFWEDRILHPEDRDWALEFCRQATGRGADHEFDYRAVAEDGRVVWLKDRVRVVMGRSGRPRLLRGVMIDITAERAAAERLRESEEKFRQIAENVREVFWIFDACFTEAIYVSPAYEELWGRPLTELYEDTGTFLEGVHPEDRGALQDAMRAVAEGPFHGVEYRIVRPDGTVRWALSRGYPIRDEAGEIYRVVGTTEDITDRKQAQEKLAAAEAHYRRLVENAQYAIYALDADGCFIELNRAGEALLEREPGELIGQHFSTVIVPDDLEVATRAFEQVISGEADNLIFEERVRSASGAERLIEVTEAAIRENGVIVGTHGVGRDITGEVEKDRQLRRAERLASLGTLIGGVAHELNNPLQSITHLVTLLLEGGAAGEQREDLETIQREALRVARIVSSLRMLARQAQADSGVRAPVDLNDIVRHVLRSRRYALDTAGIEVDDQGLASDLPPILADRGEIEQVLLNLLVNAEQSLEGSAQRRLAVGTRTTDDRVTFHIADSGSGISAANLEHIFDPFFTTKDPGEGTGLGLSLVYSIVTEHGGEVRVESEPGAGTTFRVDLPRAGQPQGAAEAGAAPQEAVRPLRILIVDDEPAIRSALVRYLGRRGHTVSAAADGEEALRMLEGEHADCDIILSDLRMPGLGGEDLLVRLRERAGGLDRRVVFLTGDAASGRAARVLAASNAPVLYKPVELAIVAEHVERHAEVVGPVVARSG